MLLLLLAAAAAANYLQQQTANSFPAQSLHVKASHPAHTNPFLRPFLPFTQSQLLDFLLEVDTLLCLCVPTFYQGNNACFALLWTDRPTGW